MRLDSLLWFVPQRLPLTSSQFESTDVELTLHFSVFSNPSLLVQHDVGSEMVLEQVSDSNDGGFSVKRRFFR